MSKLNVVSASRSLPPRARKPFLRAFQATGAMDLYDGNLEHYLTVIASALEDRGSEVKKLRHSVKRARAILGRGVKKKNTHRQHVKKLLGQGCVIIERAR